MSYRNPLHEDRLVLLPVARSVFSRLCVCEVPGADRVLLEGSGTKNVYRVGEVGGDNDPDLYHLPFLFHSNGDPWKEANAYLLSLMRDKAPLSRRTDDVRRFASKLLDYLIFCEGNNLDWLDFSSARPPHRPTYKYFYSLINGGGRCAAVINQYTAVVYDFYKYISSDWYELDMNRVDTTKQLRFVVKSPSGSRVVDVERRSQTRRTPPQSVAPIGFVREDGEDLRPLSNGELGIFMDAIKDEKVFSAVERLILLTSLMTGARKQTVLTMRLKHLISFQENKLLPEGAYKLHAGPGTGIDTKKDKSQTLYFPKQLAEELVTLANSPIMRRRRIKLRAKLERSNPALPLDEGDSYLFVSNQGNAYYMAKSDPRYLIVKSPPTGQVTETIRRKLMSVAATGFPKDFSYHWLRATYAYQIYQRLQILVRDGFMRPGEDIDFIQSRMHHESRETTESYLKLFKMAHEKTMAQEIWEGKLFNYNCGALNMDLQN